MEVSIYDFWQYVFVIDCFVILLIKVAEILNFKDE